MNKGFDIIEYISGLTNFTFDIAQLKRVALDCGVSDIVEYEELTEEQKDNCLIELLKLIVYGPYTTASSSNKHGNYEVTVGSQTITSTALEALKARLRTLLNKYNRTDDSSELSEASGEMNWIHEYD